MRWKLEKSEIGIKEKTGWCQASPRCQGLAAGDYDFTLGALALKSSGFCSIGVYSFL
jgi:hypothetical protein